MSAEQYIGRLRDSFTFFVEELWKDRRLDKVAPLGEVELDVLAYASCGPFSGLDPGTRPPPSEIIQEAATIQAKHEAISRRGILAPRGLGKTHLVAVSYPLWLLFRDPNHKIIINSKSKDHARKTLKIIREWINNVWFLKHLTPKDEQRDSADMFDAGPSKSARDPSVTVYGIESQITGSRAHTVINDDVETPTNTKTVTARQQLDRQVREFANVGYLGGAFEIVYVGTYHHEESVYLKLDARGYRFRSWPLVLPEPDEKVLHLAPMLAAKLKDGTGRPGDITVPHRFDQESLAEKKAEGFTHWAMQYALVCDLAATNRYPLRLSDLIVYDGFDAAKAPVSITYGTSNNVGSTAIEGIECLGFMGDKLHAPVFIDQQHGPFQGTKAFIDPAGRGEDEIAIAVVSHLAGMLWCHAVIGLRGGTSPDTLSELARICRDYRATEIHIESNWGGGLWQQIFEPVLRAHFVEPGKEDAIPLGWRASVQPYHGVGQKELRICKALEPVISTHRLVMHPRCVTPTPGLDRKYELQYQLAAITKQTGSLAHDDRIDALAGCVAQWEHVLNLSPTVAADRARDSLDKTMELFKKYGKPVGKPPTRWYTNR
jgi:hypothetical protein